MKNLFLKAMLPVAAFVLASAGAVSTSNITTKSSIDIDGWRRVSPVQCEFVQKCNNMGSTFCTSGGNRLYEKPTPASYCTGTLYHQ